MPGAEQIIERIDGLVSTLGGAKQNVAVWAEQVKVLLRSDGLKDKTDWEFTPDETVIQATSSIYVGASTVYGALIGTISADAEQDHVYITDVAAGDFVGTAVDTDDWICVQLPACATAGVEEFHTVLVEGIYYAAGIDVGADGNAGTNPGATDIRIWVLYRTGI